MSENDSWTTNSTLSTTSSISSDSNSDENVQRIVLHVYDDESKEFTSLTTYHGMIRIYTSQTWPSRIFWTFVVVTCLVLFMIQTGGLLMFYNTHPTTYQLESFPITDDFSPNISICPSGFKHNDYLYNFVLGDYKNLNSSLDTKMIVEKYSYDCKDVIDTVSIGSQKYSGFCNEIKTELTEVGKCFTFGSWRRFSTNNLVLNFKEEYTADTLILLDSSSKTTLQSSTNFYIRPQTFSIFSFSVIEKLLLPLNDWGTCNPESGFETGMCNQECNANSIAKECGCQPFFSNLKNYTYCKIEEMRNCKIAPLQNPCNCSVQQNIFEYNSDSLKFFKSSRTTLKIMLTSKNVQKYKQYKRFKQIDLMSYVGGVMGLFLGMSCITLLEVFIYLFKTVFGQFNDLRHQKFVDGLLGDSGDNDLHRSHEEIIITKKIEPNIPIIVENGNEIEAQENIGNRRMSVAGRKMSLNDKGLKIQLYRPNLGTRRKSVYQEACDF